MVTKTNFVADLNTNHKNCNFIQSFTHKGSEGQVTLQSKEMWLGVTNTGKMEFLKLTF